MSLNITMEIKGGKELARRLAEIDQGIVRKAARGAIGEAANVIRNQAVANARAVGLGRSGEVTTPSGRKIILRGGIPGSIHASVEPSRSKTTVAKTYVAPYGALSGPGSLSRASFNWVWIEFGSIRNTPRPFFVRAGREAASAAVDAAYNVLAKVVASMNRGA